MSRKIFEGYILIGFLVLIGFVLRVVEISSVPPSLNWDEVSHGYNAYSILKTGRDEWGKSFPLIFRAYGDYKLPVYIYLTAIFVLFFGLSSFSVRIISVLAGTLSILFAYLLAVELFWDSKIKRRYVFMTATLMTIEPWSFFVSRAAFEANLALFFLTCGLYFLLSGLRKENWKILFGAILIAFTFWTYNSYRIFTPLFMAVIILIYRRELLKISKKKTSIAFASFFIFLLFLVPMLYQLLSITGQARYSWVGILDRGAIGRIIELRSNSNLNSFITRFMFNRPSYFLYHFLKNYISHFSISFLFLKGGSNFQFSIPGRSLLYVVDAPLLLFGLIKIFQNPSKKNKLILSWIVLAPVASSLTREAPHVLRYITILPVPMILTAVGLSEIKFNLVAQKTIFIFYLILISLLTVDYFVKYFGHYRSSYSYVWQYGYKEAISYIKENYAKYDKIVITKKYGEPHEFVLFYWPWDPSKYQADNNLIRFNKSNWYWVDGFDKFYFVNDWEVVNKNNDKQFDLESGKVVNCSSIRCLLVTSPGNAPSNWKLIKTIDFLDGKKAFEIYEN